MLQIQFFRSLDRPQFFLYAGIDQLSDFFTAWANSMIENTPPTHQIQRFYDRMGARYDWFEMYEGRAKARALEMLHLAPGQVVLNVGVGTGKEHADVQSAILPDGLAIPDPASRFNPDDIHAASALTDPLAYAWRNGHLELQEVDWQVPDWFTDHPFRYDFQLDICYDSTGIADFFHFLNDLS